MDEKTTQFLELNVGRKVAVAADTSMGPVSTRGEVTYVGSHHFRVRCKPKIPENYLVVNQEIRVSVTEQSGVLPLTTQFVRILEKDPRIVILRLPDGAWQRNRRAFFRGEIELDVILIRKDGTRLEGKTVNLSGGGALLNTDVPLQLNEEIHVAIRLSDSEEIEAQAKVVRSNKTSEGDEFGIHFFRITNRNQNYICRIVLVDEFENRRAELRDLTGRSGNR